MAALTWDAVENRLYETGISKGVFYPYDANTPAHPYSGGVAWNGLTAVNESPDGADITTLYADNIEYLHILSPEKFGFTIECYDYPEEFNECIGRKPVKLKISNVETTIPGLFATSQNHKMFGFCYRTEIGSEANNELGYKIHLVYGCKSQPTDESRDTINDSPDAMTKSFECTSTPMDFSTAFGATFKPTAHVVIDSRKIPSGKMTALLNKLYGTGTAGSGTAPELPLPADLYSLVH